MLVEFSVQNFRSIREEQRFSMLATSAKEHESTHVLRDPAPGVERLLRSAVIYGANAAGKSNLFLAMDLMGDIVVGSSNESAREIPIAVSPYCLDENVSAPTKLEAVFIVNGVKYQYGFSATSSRFLEEWLYAFPEKRAQEWFHRTFNEAEGKYAWKFGSNLKGQKGVWSSSTRDNALFLSTAVQLNSEQMAPIYNFFRSLFRVNTTGELRKSFSRDQLSSEIKKARMVRFLKAADIGVEDLDIREETPGSEVIETIKKLAPEAEQGALIKDRATRVIVKHRKSDGEEIWIALDEESRGTQKLFSFAGPILDVLENGYTFAVDELNNSLHPLIVKEIVRSFHDVELNSKGAQLIFVTHASSMLDLDIFRRDQIWFVEKAPDGGTRVYPLTDFSPRKDVSLEKGYLQGRYGAIPFISQAVF